MSYDREQVLEAYRRIGTVKGVCDQTGCPPYIATIWLKKARLLTPKDNQSYGTKSSKNGALAEAEFQRLVPEAVSANTHIQENNPVFDFMIGDLTVDIKYSSLWKTVGKWGFRTALDKAFAPDLYCAFLATQNSGKLSDGYHILLIPSDLADGKSITLTPSNQGSPWWQFAVAPDQLRAALLEMADMEETPN